MSKLNFPTPCIFLLLCFFFFYYLAAIPVAYSNNETDFQALVAFKNAMNSVPQGALISWNETLHFCSWQGIFCSKRHQNRVVEINLMSQGLTGPISPHLGNLSFLRSINIQNNTFYGQIPNEIGRLRRLEYAEFSSNSFIGEIPKNLSQCENIYYLNLIDNNLTGIIPLELTSLMKLEKLGLSDNYLSGTIPPFIGNFTSLVQLSLVNCGMQGEIPESLVQLKSLKVLLLSQNNLTGSIPPSLFNISTMSLIQLASNKLQGTIPPDIGSTFSSLVVLDLWGNLFTGEIPASLSNITSLNYLLLEKNNFKGRVKIDFSRLSALKILNIGKNLLEGDINFISSMINCTRLTYLSIYSNQLSGSLSHSIANLSSSLIGLALENTDLDGPIPSEIGKLNKLIYLDLSRNSFTSDIPSSFGNLTSLLYLYLKNNNFSGNIPQSLSNCTNLLEFDISYNSFSGPIPPQIMSHLSSSVHFDMSHNAFTGSIPVEVGSLINMEVLDLSYNRLSGHVPNTLSSCVTLQEIYFQSNSFDGEIPDGLKSMRGLQRMDLSKNNISGTIPTFLGEFDLLYLNLSFNRLEGRVPSQGVFLNESAFSLEGNKDLCGGIPSLNFTPCSLESSKKSHFPVVFKVLIIVIGVGAIAFACYCIFICWQRKSKGSQTSMIASEAEYVRISYADLLNSTGGFSDLNLLGSGKFGFVYKGILHNMQGCVAVKVLNLNVTGASKSFVSECNILRSTRHRNLVKIVSACSSTDFQGNDFKALVYEFMVNGDLDQWLHQKPVDGRGTLSLRQRLDIIIDIASAIEYLHFGTDSTIVHGDLKPSNVLLDETMTAHVGDFGLAKIISNILSTNESSSVAIKGTIGYIPPEYGMGGNVSTHGDVYSYGILLLEMLTGNRPTNDNFKESMSLPVFVKSGLSSEVMGILDPVILQEYKNGMNVELKKCVTSVLEIGLACSVEQPGDRMDMTEVVNRLCGAIQSA